MVGAMLVALLLLSVSAVAAQSREQFLQETIAEKHQMIAQWERLRTVQLSAGILVIILGAVTAGLSHVQTKKTIAVLGTAIMALTGIGDFAFTDDHRALARKIVSGRSLLWDAEDLLRLATDLESEEKANQFRSVRAKIKGFERLERGEGYAAQIFGQQASSRRFNFVSALHAQQRSSKPQWLQVPPEDARDLYFVGTTRGSFLEVAEQASADQAVQKALQYLVDANKQYKNGPLSLRQRTLLAEYLHEVSDIIDTYVDLDLRLDLSRPESTANEYEFSSLLQVSRTFVSDKALAALDVADDDIEGTMASADQEIELDEGQLPTTFSVAVTADTPEQGQFGFLFSTQHSSEGTAMRLDHLQVHNDGSAGSTLWLFDVTIEGRTISLPLRRYSDGGSVAEYRFGTGDDVEIILTDLDDDIHVEITGFTREITAK